MPCQYSELSMDSMPTAVIPPDLILATIHTNLTFPLREQILAAQTDAPPKKSSFKCSVPVIYASDCYRPTAILRLLVTLGKIRWWVWNLFMDLLQPIPNRECLLSHLAMDFIVDLPLFQGFTVILMAVDHFSRCAINSYVYHLRSCPRLWSLVSDSQGRLYKGYPRRDLNGPVHLFLGFSKLFALFNLLLCQPATV